MKPTVFNLIIFIFATFAISRVFLRFKSKELTLAGFIFWMIIWLTIFAGTLFPIYSIGLAKIIGIGRGVDSAFFVSILLLFYLIFRLYIKLDKIDKDITELSTKVSKKIHKQDKDQRK